MNIVPRIVSLIPHSIILTITVKIIVIRLRCVQELGVS